MTFEGRFKRIKGSDSDRQKQEWHGASNIKNTLWNIQTNGPRVQNQLISFLEVQKITWNSKGKSQYRVKLLQQNWKNALETMNFHDAKQIQKYLYFPDK